jgi:hypothetical protein
VREREERDKNAMMMLYTQKATRTTRDLGRARPNRKLIESVNRFARHF